MDFTSVQDAISSTLVDTVRSASQVSAHDLAYYRSLNPSVGSSIDRQNARLFNLAERLMRSTSIASSSRTRTLADSDSVEENWSNIVDLTDGLLEKTDSCLDEFSGLRKAGSPRHQASSPAPKPQRSKLSEAFRPQNLPKPQLLFESQPDNYARMPFKPFLTNKPHKIVPIEDSFRLEPGDQGSMQYQNPYEYEIRQYQYPPSMYEERDPIPYKPFNSNAITFVDDVDKLAKMLTELKQASEIAVDLEHHDTHSYVGIVCLMQISTRDHDWIIDTLKPWRRKLESLNEVFADPRIVKVLHGASMDVIWLQRDFGVYVVGLFDTFFGSRALGYSSHSLAYLLKRFVNFDAQKQYQLADWRLRPLPAELFDYARSDTHFLLYIYDCMRNELIASSNFQVAHGDKIQDVLHNSTETALQRYEMSAPDNSATNFSGSWYRTLQRNPSMLSLSPQQVATFKDIYNWRDVVAREEDESPFSILPNHVISNIASAMPIDVPSLLAVSHPISEALRKRSEEVLRLIRNASASDGLVIGSKRPRVARPTMSKPNSSVNTQLPTENLHSINVKHLDTVPFADPMSRMAVSRFWGPTLPCSSASSLVANPWIGITVSLAGHAGGSDFFPSSQDTSFTNGNSSGDPPGSVQGFSDKPADPGGEITKRKREIAKPPLESDDQDRSIQANRYKVQKKAEQKSKSRAMKEHESPAVSVGGNADGTAASSRPSSVEAIPFDYESTPSLLASNDTSIRTSRGRKPFNPYSKATEGPSGLKSARRPEVGKSTTFKS